MLRRYWNWFLYADYCLYQKIIFAASFLLILLGVLLVKPSWTDYKAHHNRIVALESQWIVQTDLLSNDFERNFVSSAALDPEAIAYHFDIKVKAISNNIYFYGDTSSLVECLGVLMSQQADIKSLRIQSTAYKPLLAISL